MASGRVQGLLRTTRHRERNAIAMVHNDVYPKFNPNPNPGLSAIAMVHIEVYDTDPADVRVLGT